MYWKLAGLLSLTLAILLTAWALVRGVRKGAQAEVRADTAEREADHAKDANKVRTEIDRLPDGAAADRLRDRWSRD